MKKVLWIVLCCCLTAVVSLAQRQVTNSWCNPLNLNYRFGYDATSYREAADPVVHVYKEKYYLYASKSGGYWYSDDLLQWTFRPSRQLPVEDYAPTVVTIRDTVFFMASKGARKIYFSTNPLEDNWQVYRESFPLSVTDPALFKDDDGRVYFYYGCSNVDPLCGVELDTVKRFDTIGKPAVLINHRFREFGWEESGEAHRGGKSGWNEGSWMTRHAGKYYLQYAAPGTEFKTYGDGVYVSDRPLGPFRYMENSPFSYKPGGFINGAGHGNTFQDKYGNYWHSATMTISVRHMFERRIGLFPAFFDKDGVLHCETAFGDYPAIMPNRKMDLEKESLFAGWMLLSYNKPVIASSSMAGHEPGLALDEEVRSWWSANSGQKGEWLQTDLKALCAIQALQVNFADEGCRLKAGESFKPYQYTIESSVDGRNWTMLADKSNNTDDVTHDYIALPQMVKARYLRITGLQVPDGRFSISGLRVFGKGSGNVPAPVSRLRVTRDTADSRRAMVGWNASRGATGYVVRFGTERGKLYHSVMVYGQHALELPGLNDKVPYFFSVDAFNENGVRKGRVTMVN